MVALLLTGCGSPVTSAYISEDSGQYVLTVPDDCSYAITEVVVKNYDEADGVSFGEMETIWSATADADTSATEITLFESNPGFTSAQDSSSSLPDNKIIVWWQERWDNGNSAESSLIGSLEDVDESSILWFDGTTSVEAYEREVSSPFARFRC